MKNKLFLAIATVAVAALMASPRQRCFCLHRAASVAGGKRVHRVPQRRVKWVDLLAQSFGFAQQHIAHNGQAFVAQPRSVRAN